MSLGGGVFKGLAGAVNSGQVTMDVCPLADNITPQLILSLETQQHGDPHSRGMVQTGPRFGEGFSLPALHLLM
jgi:hypothetical protein